MKRVPSFGVALALSFLGPAAARAADPMFDSARVHDVRLEMDRGDWESLKREYLTNQYYAANIAIDGEVVQQVGVRSRGAGSRSGSKPGLKVDFNKYVSGQQFHEYKSVVLDNLVQDASMLREPMALRVFEAMGIPAPQAAHARLTVNGEYAGLYTLVEAVSRRFLGQRLGEDGGNLFDYEYDTDYRFAFRGDDPGAYIPKPFEPETNEKSLDGSGLVAFIKAVNQADDASFVSQVSGFLDARRFLTYLATENALAEFDGFVGEFGMNNFYLYQYAGSNRFVFIPWDKDTAFKDAAWPVLQRMEDNVLSRRLLADAALKAHYLSEVKRAVTSFVNARWLTPQIESVYGLIREAALTDDKKPFSNNDFELGVGGLKGVVAGREADVLRQIP